MEERERNNHYSEQTGHAARGEHARVKKALGINPEGVPGFEGIMVTRGWLVRRSMRRTPKDGKR